MLRDRNVGRKNFGGIGHCSFDKFKSRKHLNALGNLNSISGNVFVVKLHVVFVVLGFVSGRTTAPVRNTIYTLAFISKQYVRFECL
jgi:hypothetical protein